MITIRDMEAREIDRCISIRSQTRENRWSLEALHKAGITVESVAARLDATHHGWVCECDGQIVGFSMGDRSNGELWVIAVLPDFEGRGIGTRLLESAQEWLHDNGWPEIWLWTSPDTATRAYWLYTKLGWRNCGLKNGELIMRHGQLTPEVGEPARSLEEPTAQS